jgi:hypothetical protein
MSQNRTGLQADQRNRLDLQINLLAEDENTKMLQMLQALCEYVESRALPHRRNPSVRRVKPSSSPTCSANLIVAILPHIILLLGGLTKPLCLPVSIIGGMGYYRQESGTLVSHLPSWCRQQPSRPSE